MNTDFATIYPTLNRRLLMALGGRKNHGLGPFGFDAERDERTSTVDTLRAHLVARHGMDALETAFAARPTGCVCPICTTGQPRTTLPRTTTTTTKETPAMPTPATPAPGDAATNLAAAIAAIAAQSVDVATVRRIVDEALAGQARPERVVYVNRHTGTRHEGGDYQHPAFDEIVENMANGISTLLVGPAGSGKTTLGREVAKVLGRKATVIGCAGSSPITFTGNWLPTGEGGAFDMHLSDFAKACIDGDNVVVLDEFDRVNPADALTLNDVLASGEYRIPGYGTVRQADTTGIIATANTFGSGSDPMYVSEMLDSSTLSRFDCAVIHVDYDRDLEKRIGSDALLAWAWKVRDVIDSHGIRRTMSTRTIVKAQQMLDMGRPMATVQQRYFAAWSRTERSKVGYTGK